MDREHQLRVAAENALADVRRGGAVPALMDALVKVSALTDGLYGEERLAIM